MLDLTSMGKKALLLLLTINLYDSKVHYIIYTNDPGTVTDI